MREPPNLPSENIKNINPWYQAAQLIQPALIRLLDQLRKALESSAWQGRYETVEVWPDQPDGGAKSGDLEAESSVQPQVLYWLHLTRSPAELKINLWELCYQICFSHYEPDWHYPTVRDFQVGEVEVDTTLFEANGEVDWNSLDAKTEQIVRELFASLPESADG